MKYTVYLFLFFTLFAKAQLPVLDNYNPIWNTQSSNSSESMPLGAGDIGLNVWVEKGDLYSGLLVSLGHQAQVRLGIRLDGFQLPVHRQVLHRCPGFGHVDVVRVISMAGLAGGVDL